MPVRDSKLCPTGGRIGPIHMIGILRGLFLPTAQFCLRRGLLVLNPCKLFHLALKAYGLCWGDHTQRHIGQWRRKHKRAVYVHKAGFVLRIKHRAVHRHDPRGAFGQRPRCAHGVAFVPEQEIHGDTNETDPEPDALDGVFHPREETDLRRFSELRHFSNLCGNGLGIRKLCQNPEF